jgi:hypothetical protein
MLWRGAEHQLRLNDLWQQTMGDIMETATLHDSHNVICLVVVLWRILGVLT